MRYIFQENHSFLATNVGLYDEEKNDNIVGLIPTVHGL